MLLDSENGRTLAKNTGIVNFFYLTKPADFNAMNCGLPEILTNQVRNSYTLGKIASKMKGA